MDSSCAQVAQAGADAALAAVFAYHLPSPLTFDVKLLFVLALLTAVVVAQDTKWAALPNSNARLLWISVGVALLAYFFLRSGWGRPERHADEQRALGTISNSYYEPRRVAILNGITIGGGLAGAMWWGATSWIVLVRGIQRETAAHGLINLQVSVVVGALAGGMVGAAFGVIAGELWERRHRQRRAAQGSLPRSASG
jgi:hypothetical protein